MDYKSRRVRISEIALGKGYSYFGRAGVRPGIFSTLSSRLRVVATSGPAEFKANSSNPFNHRVGLDTVTRQLYYFCPRDTSSESLALASAVGGCHGPR